MIYYNYSMDLWGGIFVDINEELLIKLLSCGIRGTSCSDIGFEGEDIKGINWTTIYEKAKLHDVHTLIFPVLHSLKAPVGPGEELMEEWQRCTLFTAAHQCQHVVQVSKVLEAFNKEGIPVISLKGLVLRDLYPQAELRTMGDADILICEEDMDHTRELMLKLGYKEGYLGVKHLHFSHKDYPTIEVHWTLVDLGVFPKGAWFDSAVWEETVQYNLFNVPTLSLSIENEMLHLCLHMAVHLITGGFGLRQLCDFLLLIEANEDNINWGSFMEKARILGLEQFLCTILGLCNKYFGLNIKEIAGLTSRVDVEELLHDILEGGVFGKSSMDRKAGGLFTYYLTGKAASSSQSVLRRYLSLFFPSAAKLSNKYGYAKKYSILLPIAWLHRLIYIAIRKDISLEHKRIFLSAKATGSAIDRRTKLLQNLGLQ
jgi:hypothetical protein